MKNAIYNVYLQHGGNKVLITLDGYDPSPDEPFTKEGSFSFGADGVTNQISPRGLTSNNGDHAFVANAKEVLRSKGYDVRENNYVFEDRASNSPLHDEDFISTDDLRVVDEGHDPDISSQAGGVASTDPEVDNTETKPNGIEDAHVREDEGEGTSEGTHAADQTQEQDKRGEPRNGFTETQTGGGTEDAPSEPVEEVTGTEASDTETTETTEAKETVAQLKERISKITDKAELEKAYADEQAGQDRSTALKAIEERAAELGD